MDSQWTAPTSCLQCKSVRELTSHRQWGREPVCGLIMRSEIGPLPSPFISVGVASSSASNCGQRYCSQRRPGSTLLTPALWSGLQRKRKHGRYLSFCIVQMKCIAMGWVSCWKQSFYWQWGERCGLSGFYSKLFSGHCICLPVTLLGSSGGGTKGNLHLEYKLWDLWMWDNITDRWH